MTSRLRGAVKLVGPTISCEGQPQAPDGGPGRHNPHVQSYVVAMDKVGFVAKKSIKKQFIIRVEHIWPTYVQDTLLMLWADNTTLQCYDSMGEVIHHAELGASAVLLEAGYTIDSLMTRYQGVDWRDQRNWDCNGGCVDRVLTVEAVHQAVGVVFSDQVPTFPHIPIRH